MYTLLKFGSRNDSVKELKRLLNAKLGTNLDVDNNYFGSTTQSTVKQLQKKFGLIQDGIVGDLTWETLYGRDAADKSSCYSISDTFKLSVATLLTAQIGVKEKTGKNDGVEVEQYLESVGLGKGYAWCQAFLYWGFDNAANALGFKNPMPKTAGVLDCWNKSKAFQVKKKARPESGDVFTMDFGKGQGHAGFVLEVVGEYIHTVEGNTSADPSLPSEDRDGQGVYKRRRKISSINNGFIRYTIS